MCFLTIYGGFVLHSKLTSLWSCKRLSLSCLSWIHKWSQGDRFHWRLLLQEAALCSVTQEEFWKNNVIKWHPYWPHHYPCRLEASCMLLESWSRSPMPRYFFIYLGSFQTESIWYISSLLVEKKKILTCYWYRFSQSWEAVFKNSRDRGHYLMTDLWYVREIGSSETWGGASR